jgi:TrmH family RNA methyltransferase
MVFIASPANPRVRALVQLHTPRGRKKSGLFLMEGPHLLEVLFNAGVKPVEIYYQPALLRRTSEGQHLLDQLLNERIVPADRLVEVSERVIEAISDTQTSQGVICVLHSEEFHAGKVAARRSALARPALLILDDLADPGNMGTIMRTALAADVERVLLTPRCVDYLSPKVVRSAAGAHIGLPIEADLSWQEIEARVTLHCEGVPRVLLAEAGSPHMYYEQDLTQPFALIIGNEAHGPSQAARKLATLSVTITLANQVESLNAAMATGIILYEAVRQRS